MKNLMLCAALAFAVRASGQTTYQPPPLEVPLIPTVQSQLPNTLMGVVIESWRYDPAQKAVHPASSESFKQGRNGVQHFHRGEVCRWEHKLFGREAERHSPITR